MLVGSAPLLLSPHLIEAAVVAQTVHGAWFVATTLPLYHSVDPPSHLKCAPKPSTPRSSPPFCLPEPARPPLLPAVSLW
ncbi:hypothetical protein BKA56DRAFT_567765 [Ilyonectria sp. MPI-CAGE-AT-0026]|nr:hypothetical protein BKA56DRAFT_567765 [Ilyonectria sp. MPI-CAGE-AT-0026]